MSTRSPSNLGRKLRQLRVRNKISQLELENNAGIATGSLTKIESGKVQPNPQTLKRIIKNLELLPFEAMSLSEYGLPFVTGMLNETARFSLLESESELAQAAVNYVPKTTRLLGASFCNIEGDFVRSLAFTQSWYTDILMTILPVAHNAFRVSISKSYAGNLLVKAVVDQREYESKQLEDFTSPTFSPRIAKMLQKTANVKSLLAIPLVAQGESVGVILYVQDHLGEFDSSIEFLRAYTNLVAAFMFRLRLRYAKS